MAGNARITGYAAMSIVALLLCACGTRLTDPADQPAASGLPRGLDPAGDRDPFPSVYAPTATDPFAISGASVYTGAGEMIADGLVLVRDGGITKDARGAGIRHCARPAAHLGIAVAGSWQSTLVVSAGASSFPRLIEPDASQASARQNE